MTVSFYQQSDLSGFGLGVTAAASPPPQLTFGATPDPLAGGSSAVCPVGAGGWVGEWMRLMPQKGTISHTIPVSMHDHFVRSLLASSVVNPVARQLALLRYIRTFFIRHT